MEVSENSEESTIIGENVVEYSRRLMPIKQLSLSGSKGGAQCNHSNLSDSTQNLINDMRQCPPHSRSKILQIISASEKRALSKLSKNGAWPTLFSWLLEARAVVDKPLMIELMKVFSILPIVPQLFKNEETCLEVVHALTRSPDQEIKEYSSPLFKKWKESIDSRASSEDGNIESEASNGVVVESKKNTIELSRNGICKTAKSRNNSKFRSHGFETENYNASGIPNPRCSKLKFLDDDDKCCDSTIENVKNGSPEKEADQSTCETFIHDSNENPRKRKHLELSESQITNTPKRIKLVKEISPDKMRIADSLKAKKRVRWPADDYLCQYSYFDIIPGERINFKPSQPPPIRIPLSKEPDGCNVTTSSNSCVISPSVLWKCIPIEIERKSNATDNLDNDLPEPGSKSLEKNIQAEREKHTLSALYFSKYSVPDSPAEPCITEETDHANCIEIPLDLENIDEADRALASKYHISQFTAQPDPQMEATKKPNHVNLDGSDGKNKKPPKNMNPSPLNENYNANKTTDQSTNARQNDKVVKFQTKSQPNSQAKKICVYFTRGICKFGERCRNLHPTNTFLNLQSCFKAT